MEIEEVKEAIFYSEYCKNKDIEKLTELALSLYLEKRIENTDLENDGDMLLFQWGENGDYFEIDITRQVIYEQGEMQQLQSTFRYLRCEETLAFKDGYKWCDTPHELPDFRKFIKENLPFQWALRSELSNVNIELSYI